MRQYIIRNPEPRRWQVVAAYKARAIESETFASDTEREQSYNRAATVTLRTKKAAREFIGKIGGAIAEPI